MLGLVQLALEDKSTNKDIFIKQGLIILDVSLELSDLEEASGSAKDHRTEIGS